MSETAKTASENLAAGRTAMAFGTPISSYEWPASDALNESLREMILAKEAESDGIKRSNVGGWHSENDLLAWEGSAIETFRDRLKKFSSDITAVLLSAGDNKKAKLTFSMEAWANVSREGNYNSVHDHPMAHLSGVYYVSCTGLDPTIPTAGRLELLDPRVAINQMRLKGSIYEGRYVIDPAPGLMVFFPSWLKHIVHPYRGTGERISISFNVTIREKKPEPE
ncbi:MAG: 2OG-Fe(II) oxygenase family protein [Pseudomonadota bacterium]